MDFQVTAQNILNVMDTETIALKTKQKFQIV